VADNSEFNETDEPGSPGVSISSPKMVVVLIVLALFAGLIAAKVLTPRPQAGAGTPIASSMTSVHNDAVTDYQAALKAGKPIYVLFHSLS
jgi:hypothetical protein